MVCAAKRRMLKIVGKRFAVFFKRKIVELFVDFRTCKANKKRKYKKGRATHCKLKQQTRTMRADSLNELSNDILQTRPDDFCDD